MMIKAARAIQAHPLHVRREPVPASFFIQSVRAPQRALGSNHDGDSDC